MDYYSRINLPSNMLADIFGSNIRAHIDSNHEDIHQKT